jgi:hypothetical protein
MADSQVVEALGVRVSVLGSGGSALSSSIVNRFKCKINYCLFVCLFELVLINIVLVLFNCDFAIGYGITEVGGITSDDRILPGVSIRIQDPTICENVTILLFFSVFLIVIVDY